MKTIKTITVVQLESISANLASDIKQLAEHLTEEVSGVQSGYWVAVEETDSGVYILADNGFDVSVPVKVSGVDAQNILALVRG